MIRLAILVLMTLGAPAMASEEVVLGLSRDRVSISTDFDGSDILIYGAVKRDSPAPEAGPLEVVLTVSGPRVPITVWKKARRFGIWVNSEAVEIDSAPSFYAVATSAPFGTVLTAVEDLRQSVSLDRAIRSVGAPDTVEDAQAFTDALIRIREDARLYRINERVIDIREETLFSTSVRLPANLTEGAYAIRIFLTRDGRVVGQSETSIEVTKVGIERWLYNLSRELPIAYGALAVALALFAGWLAAAVSRLIRSG